MVHLVSIGYESDICSNKHRLRLRQIKGVHSKAALENFSVPSSPTVRRASPSVGLRLSSAPISGLTDVTEYIIK